VTLSVDPGKGLTLFADPGKGLTLFAIRYDPPIERSRRSVRASAGLKATLQCLAATLRAGDLRFESFDPTGMRSGARLLRPDQNDVRQIETKLASIKTNLAFDGATHTKVRALASFRPSLLRFEARVLHSVDRLLRVRPRFQPRYAIFRDF
jgi:hypothetical protein